LKKKKEKELNRERKNLYLTHS